ncbi:hypothetical protein Tco_0642355 [Tanacetum coccineum]
MSANGQLIIAREFRIRGKSAFKNLTTNCSNIGGEIAFASTHFERRKNPSEHSPLESFLQEILEGGMIRIHSAFVHDKAGNVSHDVAPKLHLWRNRLHRTKFQNGSFTV